MSEMLSFCWPISEGQCQRTTGVAESNVVFNLRKIEIVDIQTCVGDLKICSVQPRPGRKPDWLSHIYLS